MSAQVWPASFERNREGKPSCPFVERTVTYTVSRLLGSTATSVMAVPPGPASTETRPPTPPIVLRAFSAFAT